MYLKKTIFLLLLIAIGMASFAQVRSVSGVITDPSGDAMIGVSVKEKGVPANGAVSDADGHYTLSNLNENSILIFSYLGFETKEINVGNQSTINIALAESDQALDEVVVIGYQTVRRKDLTGAVASISNKEVTAAPVANVAQAIQGRLPGVNVMVQDGRPDADIAIRVRGGGSISQSNEPLVLINGVPGQISDVPAALVASIDVLKDASSTAIYGARGANGVILITTKNPQAGYVSVTYGGYASFNTPTGYFDVLSPYEYLAHKWGLLDTYYPSTHEVPFETLFGLGANKGNNTAGIDAYKNVPPYEMQKKVYNESFSHNHDLAISGGTDKTKMLFSVNYLDNEGMKLMSYFKRASVSAKLDQKISNSLSLDVDTRYTDTKAVGNESTTNGLGSRLSGSYRFRPIAVSDMKGDINMLGDGSISGEDKFSMYDVYSPVSIIESQEDMAMRQNLRATAGVNWEIIKGLTFRTELNMQREWRQNKNWRGKIPRDGNQEDYIIPNTTGQEIASVLYAGDVDYRKRDSWGLHWTNTLNYNVILAKIHNINVLAGHEVTDAGGTDMRIQADKFAENFTKENAFAMINQYGANLRVSSGVTTPNRILSFFGRGNYTLLDRYLFTLTFRADGSSNFSPEHQWGYFPAAAFAWRASEESFMQDLDWLDHLKLRLSYGEVGNDAIAASQWQQLWGAPSNTNQRMAMQNQWQSSYDLASSQMANLDLKWETTITRNIGLDYTLFKNRLWGTVDLYWNSTKDLLMLTDIPSITGFTTTFANVGKTSNRGVEFSISALIFKNKDWNITASGNINFNKNRIDELADGIQSAYGTGFFQSGIPSSDYILQEGKPLGIVMGYKTDGKGYYTTDDFDFDPTTGMYTLKPGIPDLASAFVAQHGGIVPAGQIAYPGMPKFKDVLEDGIITEKDYVEIGNMNPKHTGGFNVNATYKNVDLGLFFNWSYGNDIYNANKLASLYTNDKGGALYANKLAIVNGSYKYYDIDGSGNLVRLTTPQELNAANQNANLPSIFLKQGYVADIGIEDGSFLRLNTLTLGYTLPKQVVNKARISNLRIYGTIYNVFTITGYSGLDPEVNTQANMNNARYPTPGLDWGTYPRPRQFVLGLNVSF